MPVGYHRNVPAASPTGSGRRTSDPRAAPRPGGWLLAETSLSRSRRVRRSCLGSPRRAISPYVAASRCAVEAYRFDYLKGSDQGPQAHEDAKEQRNCRQHFEEVDDWREQVEVRQHDVVDEVGLKRNGSDLPIISPRSINTTAAPIWAAPEATDKRGIRLR